MFGKGGLITVAFSTHGAWKRLFASVKTLVYDKSRLVCETFPTFGTHIRLIPGVRLLMLGEG